MPHSSMQHARCVMTSKSSHRALAYRSNRHAIACRRCSGRMRAVCRSSSSGSIQRATCRSASSAAGFPFARYGGSCPRWVVHTAFSQPGVVQVQVAELPDSTTYLCFARTVTRPARAWGDPRPTHVVAMGCSLVHADALAYADGLDLERAKVGIGLSCRLCDRPDCRSRAFPPLEHRLALDPQTAA